MLNFKKVNTEITKLKAGDVFIGKYTGKSTRPWVDEEGVEKEITQYHFLGVNLDTGKVDEDDKKVLFADAGMQNKFNTEGVKEGQIIRLTKEDKKDLGKGGRMVNSYELEIAQ